MESAKEYITKEKPKCQKPEDVAALMYPLTKDSTQECMYALLLNAKNGLIEMNLVGIGLVNSMQCHAREIFRNAIIQNATRLIMVHNHPSGNSAPSPQDIEVTRSIVNAGKIIGIEVTDHIIMGHFTENNPKNFTSMREANII
jgi:DNA repair protein RadC